MDTWIRTRGARPEHQHSVAVVRRGADVAYQARVHGTIQALPGGADRSNTIMARAGLTHERFLELLRSTRRVTRDEFQSFAKALRVSPRWLAIGAGEPADGVAGWVAPPEGWHTFGSPVDQPDVELEFSEALDPDDLMPRWKRPRTTVAA